MKKHKLLTSSWNGLLLALITLIPISHISAETKTATCGKTCAKTSELGNEIPASADVMAVMEKVANWQLPRIDHLDYLNYKRSESQRPKWWVQGAFQTGLTELAERSINPFYEKWIGWRGEEVNWEIGDRWDFGDDQLVGQTWLWHYKRNGGEEKIQPVKTAFDKILANPPTTDLKFEGPREPRGTHACQTRWSWADALFMAPPVWFSLSDATGDPRYFEYANKEFQATVDYLYDEDLHLMFRDSRFIGKKGEFGEQIFWARGTGWVFAGLVRCMEYIPLDHPDRSFYEKLYTEMAEKLKSLQKKDGSWAMSLLAGEKIKEPEMSGTAFFVYGLAWGIQQGLLNEEEYWPTVSKGWNSLLNSVHPDGKLGWVQGIGAAPGQVSYDDSQIYGVGGFLLAGSIIYDIAQEKELIELKKTRATYGRYVPERMDDFTWENDKVAFRIYGPAGTVVGPGSGVDAWLKRVPYPIINKWYDEHVVKGISYHEDQGEGYDPYHTGVSRGVGGTAVWVDGKPYASALYNDTKVLRNDGEQIVFQVNYNSFETPAGHVTETKVITLELGAQLYHARSTFKINGKPASLEVGIGLFTHDENANVYQNKQTGRISTWELFDGTGVGTGVLVDPGKVTAIKHLPTKEKDWSHIWIFTNTDAEGTVEFEAGFGWELAGELTTIEEWNQYLDQKN